MNLINRMKNLFSNSNSNDEIEKTSFSELKLHLESKNEWQIKENVDDILKTQFFYTTRTMQLADGTYIEKGTDFMVEAFDEGKFYLHFPLDENNRYTCEFADEYTCTLDELCKIAKPSEFGIEQYIEEKFLNEIYKEQAYGNPHEEELEVDVEEVKHTFENDKVEVEAPILENVDPNIVNNWVEVIEKNHFIQAESAIENVIITKSPKVPGGYQMTCFLDKELTQLTLDRQFSDIVEVSKALTLGGYKEVKESKEREVPYENEYKSAYEYPDCEVLKNKLDIKDQELFERVERSISSIRLCELHEKPIKGNFDFNHLSKIHKHIFKDVYDWAGKPRTEEISKDFYTPKSSAKIITNDKPMEYTKGVVNFAPSKCIAQVLKDSVFKPLKKLNYCRGMDANELSKNLAKFYCELNLGHPFKEGSGRAQREFIRELAEYNGFKLDWSKASFRELTGATIGAAVEKNPEKELNKLSNIIKGCLESLEPDKNLMKDIDKLLDWDRGR